MKKEHKKILAILVLLSQNFSSFAAETDTRSVETPEVIKASKVGKLPRWAKVGLGAAGGLAVLGTVLPTVITNKNFKNRLDELNLFLKSIQETGSEGYELQEEYDHLIHKNIYFKEDFSKMTIKNVLGITRLYLGGFSNIFSSFTKRLTTGDVYNLLDSLWESCENSCLIMKMSGEFNFVVGIKKTTIYIVYSDAVCTKRIRGISRKKGMNFFDFLKTNLEINIDTKKISNIDFSICRTQKLEERIMEANHE
ncbi:MAG: hypothetical protein LBK29_02080 [Oscillospiraceae bacterium]|jgi:hypothetical protein|nr:hypothetical protein [Oscillospiraceae bacterium]